MRKLFESRGERRELVSRGAAWQKPTEPRSGNTKENAKGKIFVEFTPTCLFRTTCLSETFVSGFNIIVRVIEKPSKRAYLTYANQLIFPHMLSSKWNHRLSKWMSDSIALHQLSQISTSAVFQRFPMKYAA
jgi:hypothetical protein